MITVELDGKKVECETEREAKKALAKLLRQQKAEAAEHGRKFSLARAAAESQAYRLMVRKARGETFPCGLRLYYPGEKYGEHICREVPGSNRSHMLSTEGNSDILLEHYGQRVIGAVCNGAGFCIAVFLLDTFASTLPVCCAVGVNDDVLCLAECPGLVEKDFRHKEEQAEAI